MAFGDKYAAYFDINPDYFPVVDQNVIKQNPDMWKSFYPHETFQNLLRDVEKILTRKNKLSLWVEGAYGTGKSHAVLTLKKLLDANENEVKEYFEKFQLENDFLNKFQNAKNGGKILTVHRYGSSKIKGDAALAFAVQESIEHAMKDAGIENKESNALKEGLLQWLEDSANKSYLNNILEQEKTRFGGDDVESVIKKLGSLEGDALMELMDKLFQVAEKRQLKFLDLDTKRLGAWIREIIEKNDLKALVFIWDEFTEFFQNNLHNLTGFQELAELSASIPFYLIIVTHKSEGLFSDSDSDKKKILGRFVSPTCNIELPENMAIKLIGQALEKKDDPTLRKEFEESIEAVADDTREPRMALVKKMHLDENDMVKVLPIHPYSAILLKFISAAFESNQRSMFKFIKDGSDDEDMKGFQWFIKNYGPTDDINLLTIDMLWDFFYEKGKDGLSHDVRMILDCFNHAENKKLNGREQRILKTALLLQAISERTGNSVDILIPTAENIQNAFKGDNEISSVEATLNQLDKDQILFKKNAGGNKYIYSALMGGGVDPDEMKRYLEEASKTTTQALLAEGSFDSSMLSLPGDIQLRYNVDIATCDNIEAIKQKVRGRENGNKISVIFTFAKNDNEQAVLSKKLKTFAADPALNNIVFVDSSVTPLGADGWKQYVEAKANVKYFTGKDNNQANQYSKSVMEILQKWRSRITSGEFLVYTKNDQGGERVSKLDDLHSKLKGINKQEYPDSLEASFNVTDYMWKSASMPMGVELGAKQEIVNAFRSSSEATKIENQLSGAWQVSEYWEKSPYLTISKIKIAVDKLIAERFKAEGKIAVGDIFDMLSGKPFGFIPCNLSAFMLGFVLKEYVDKFSYSDGTVSESLTITKLKEAVSEYLKNVQVPNNHYKPKYIVTMSKEMKAFFDITATAFNVPKSSLVSIESARDKIRMKMKEFAFPAWVFKSLITADRVKSDTALVEKVITNYTGIANSNNLGQEGAESTYAHFIGSESLKNPGLAEDLKNLLTKENSIEAMKVYLQGYENGKLPALAESIGDSAFEYISSIKEKLSAESSNWLWNEETSIRKINETILEYQIVEESNKLMSKTSSLRDCLNDWRSRCDRIKVSYAAAKNELTHISHILEALLEVKRTLSLQESQKQKFYDAVCAEGSAFFEFYNNQISIFRSVCKDYLNGFGDDSVQTIYDKISVNAFTKDKPEFMNEIGRLIDDFKRSMGAEKLKKLWKDKTGTTSPKEWSNKNSMPILAMVPENEVVLARRVFDCINRKSSDEHSVNEALDYLNSAEFFDNLKNENSRNEAFQRIILKDYSVLLSKIETVKTSLKGELSAEPYDWYGLPEVDAKVKYLAERNYNQNGYQKALEKIESMDTEKVKEYLKDLIKGNMKVGMEIIKG